MRRLLVVFIALVVLVSMIPAASAHEGSTLTCQASTNFPRSFSTWGCGWAGADANTLQANFDDRKHDHSCVYLYVKLNGSWYSTGASSCGSPTAFNKGYSSEPQGARLYRFSPYGNNYLTLPLQY